MKHISILVPDDAVLASIFDPRYMFTAVNQFLEAAGKPALFKVQLVGLTKEVRLSNGTFSVHVDLLVQSVKKTDLVIVPALSGDLKITLEKNKEFVPWIIKKYKQGA